MFRIKLKGLKFVYLLLCVSVIFLFVFVMKENVIDLLSSIRRSRRNEVFVITICRDNTSKIEENNKRQMDQAYVLLKSAALMTNEGVRFIILVEEEDVFNKILTRMENWPGRIRDKLNLEKAKVWYPESTNMRGLFHTCSTERLFLHEILPSEDSAVYLDTDTIFLKPPEDLWKEFSRFNSLHISGLSPCLYLYDNQHSDIPHYGKTGLNAGVWMMNLTRMRRFAGGWTNTCINVVNKYKGHLLYGDQDVANIIFSKNPTLLYELPCQ